MPEGIFNQKEFNEIRDLNKNAKDIAKGIKNLNDTLLKLNSKTNKNTLASRIADGIESIATVLKNKSE